MTWTDFWNGIGNMFEWGFKILKSMGNVPNVILWVLIAFLLVFWISQIVKQNKEARRNGTYK
jgi:thiosulfate reductase cytochrome b subunit